MYPRPRRGMYPPFPRFGYDSIARSAGGEQSPSDISLVLRVTENLTAFSATVSNRLIWYRSGIFSLTNSTTRIVLDVAKLIPDTSTFLPLVSAWRIFPISGEI